MSRPRLSLRYLWQLEPRAKLPYAHAFGGLNVERYLNHAVSEGSASWENLVVDSTTLCDETGDACFHHLIEPLSGRNAIDFVQRVFWEGGNIKILSRASRAFGCGKQSGAALHRPCQQHLSRSLSHSCGDCRNHGILEQPRLHPVTQWRESQKHNAFFFAEFQKFRFRQIWMRFYLHHGWLDSCRFIDGQQFIQADVRQSDSPTPAVVESAGPPCGGSYLKPPSSGGL